jgi:hypothetical protein
LICNWLGSIKLKTVKETETVKENGNGNCTGKRKFERKKLGLNSELGPRSEAEFKSKIENYGPGRRMWHLAPTCAPSETLFVEEDSILREGTIVLPN